MLLFICIILKNQSESQTIKKFLQMALLFEPNSFYILLLNLDHHCHFEWQLFLALTTTTGQLFHRTNDPGSVGWEYKSEMADMSTNGRLVIALQIGVIGPVLHAALATRLGLVPLTGFSGRYRDLCSKCGFRRRYLPWMTKGIWILEGMWEVLNKRLYRWRFSTGIVGLDQLFGAQGSLSEVLSLFVEFWG